jgi:rRNA maturation endonuclease Nob1
MPSVDIQPVKHGKWKHIAGMNSKCSVCSHYFPVTEFDSRPFDINFCPNCGARMDGDSE